MPVGTQTMDEDVKRGFDSEDTSESGRAPSDYEESSDEDGGAIPSDADVIMQDDSGSDYGHGMCWESDSDSIGESVDLDIDSSSHLLHESDAEAIFNELRADEEPLWDSMAVQMLLE